MKIKSKITALAIGFVMTLSMLNLNSEAIRGGNIALSNIAQLSTADAETGCPNGCLTYSGHCWCNGYYPYREASW